MEHNTHNGYTCLPLDRLQPKVCEYLQVSESEFLAAYQAAQKEGNLVSYQKETREFVYLPAYYEAEQYIADRIGVLRDFSAPEDQEIYLDLIKREETEQGIQYAELQRKAILSALSRGLLILTGGPGTGKTTTLNGMISLFEKQGYQVMLAAPTGRAAQRISDLTGYEAKTIHRLLEVEFDMAGATKFRHNESNPLTCDVMIVDEMSMVDVLLFESLLRALRFSCKLIMVGDSDQLPSVGAGNVLKEMRFLCAEDNELNAEILMELLKIEGAECTICENGKRVLEAFEQSAPGDYDMILMDVQMPVMNGYEATKAIRRSSHELAKTIPIIAMTANAFSEDIQHSLAAGMNAHVSKPVEMKVLEKTIRSIKSGGGHRNAAH